jgi:hypothetical protein
MEKNKQGTCKAEQTVLVKTTLKVQTSQKEVLYLSIENSQRSSDLGTALTNVNCILEEINDRYIEGILSTFR